MTSIGLWTAAACLALAGAAQGADAHIDRHGDPLPDGVAARMGTVRFRHGGDVWFVGFLSDSKTILSIGKDDALRWWRATSGKQLSSWSAGAAILSCASLSADRRVLAARVGDDVMVWDALSGQQLRKLEKPDSKLLGVACSPDGKTVATCGARIRIWDAASGDLLRDCERVADGENAVAFCPDGALLVSTGKESEIRWWDVESGKVIHSTEGAKAGALLAISQDGKRLAACGFDSTLRIWDAVERSEQCSVSAPPPSAAILSMAFSPDSKQLAVGCADRVIRLYDSKSGHEVRRFEGHQAGVAAVAFSEDGAILVSGGGDGAVRQWDVATGKEIRPYAGPAGQVQALAVSPDGATVASAGIDERIHLWNSDTGEERRALPGAAGDEVGLLAFSPDGRTLTAVSHSGRSEIRLWSAEDGKPLLSYSPSDMGFSAPFALSPDGTLAAAAASPFHLVLLDAHKKQAVREFEGDDSRGALQAGPFLGAGGLAMFHHAHGSYSKIDGLLLWSVATGGRDMAALHGDIGNVCTCAASADGKVLAAAGADGRVQLRNIESGDVIRTWDAGKDFILAVCFSGDGRTLATADLDGSVSVWETATGERRARLEGGQGFIDALAFSPRGNRLYTGGHDGTVLAWDLTGRALRTPHKEMDDRSLDLLWDDLAGPDAGSSYRAVWALAAAEQSVPYLKAKLTRPTASAARIARWIGDLDDEDLETRWQATSQLRSADLAAETALTAALETGPSPEARRRIEDLLAWIQKARTGMHPPDPRTVRALEALEDAATPAARHALAELAEGPETSVTREAKASRVRLKLLPPP